MSWRFRCSFFFFNDTATTEIYTLSLHDALPISSRPIAFHGVVDLPPPEEMCPGLPLRPAQGRSNMSEDRKSTRLNSSHLVISYAVFCLKKKNKMYKLNVK